MGIRKHKKNYLGYILLIPFVMTLLGMLLYNRFPLYDTFWYAGAQIISFYFVSTGTIMLMSHILRRKKLDEDK
jgi:polyferredoxin